MRIVDLTPLTRILYNMNAYQAYLYKENETEVPFNDPGRDIQCQSCRPSNNFIGYGSNNQHEELEAQNVVRIRSSHWRAIAEREAKRTPSIARLQPDDTIHSISANLTDENTANADDAYSKSSKHYEADIAAVAGVNASILKFLLTRIKASKLPLQHHSSSYSNGTKYLMLYDHPMARFNRLRHAMTLTKN